MGGYYCLLHFFLVCVLLHVHGGRSMNQTCNPTDLEALLALSRELKRKGTGLVGWGPNDVVCCSWTGVSCDLGRVVGLDLSNKSLHGVLSSSVTSLDSLVMLNLSRNSLSGQVPAGLGWLTSLQLLDLSANALSGKFPASGDGGSFLAIEVVNVSSNDFTGPHPVFPGAVNLTVLDISSNAFSNSINVTALCAAPVKVLRFSVNAFTGEVPAGFSRCKVLAELSLDGNGLGGSLPGDLYAMPELRRLSLQANKLSGSLDNLGNLSQLMHIDLSYNMFTGSIPNVFGSLRELEFLNLASNRFNGTVPDSLSNCPMLRVVSLRNNSFSGEIAIDFSLLPRLNTLDAGTNKLSGAIPPGLSQCTELRTLSLSRNGFKNLSSALQVLQNLPKLKSLVLTRNFHGGETMPADGIKGFKSMKVLVLANCALSGMIPPWMQSLESLNVLDISWNKLNGKIPPWLGNLNKLFYIDLSNNSFSGGLPESFTRMRSLISSNSSSEWTSTGDLPLFIVKSATDNRLQYNHASSFPLSLILSNNLLVGPVLPGFGHLVKLHMLDLSWNNFTGQIPNELSNMSSLEVLNLAHNDLSGSIASSLTKLSFLSKFDVSYNNLAGDIPTGGQFSTFADENFLGNPGLCILRDSSCTKKVPFAEAGNEQRHGTDMVTYITVEAGFAIGLLVVWNILFFARTWRAAYFQVVDRFFDMLYML